MNYWEEYKKSFQWCSNHLVIGWSHAADGITQLPNANIWEGKLAKRLNIFIFGGETINNVVKLLEEEIQKQQTLLEMANPKDPSFETIKLDYQIGIGRYRDILNIIREKKNLLQPDQQVKNCIINAYSGKIDIQNILYFKWY